MSDADEPLKEYAMEEELQRVRAELEQTKRELQAYQETARRVIANQQARMLAIERDLEHERAMARR